MKSFFYPSPSPTSHSDTLLVALFIAAVIHVVILLGLNFKLPQQHKIRKSIEVTLSNMPAAKAPEKARFLAQDNQMGGGRKAQKPIPKQQKIPARGNSQKRQNASKATQSKHASHKKLISTQAKSVRIIQKDKQTPKHKPVQKKLDAKMLRHQIAQLGERIRHSQQGAEFNRMKFINQLSTHRYVAAQYMKDWENKVERTGNLNYPEIARQRGFSGTLTMDVGINPDGTIYSMRITKSSGIKALDDAAKRIVRLSAPFAELPAELLQEVDILVIRRVWKFSDESGITTR